MCLCITSMVPPAMAVGRVSAVTMSKDCNGTVTYEELQQVLRLVPIYISGSTIYANIGCSKHADHRFE